MGTRKLHSAREVLMKSVRVHAQTILPKPESCGFTWEVLIKTVRVSVCWNPKLEIAQGGFERVVRINMRVVKLNSTNVSVRISRALNHPKVAE